MLAMATLDTIRDRLGFDLREMAGAKLSGDIPLKEQLVNRLIGERLGPNVPFSSVRVEPLEGDAAAIHLVPRARFIPPVRVLARIERQPEFPGDPRLLLRWSLPAAGPLAALAAPLIAHFNALPPGISIDADRVAIDVAELMRSRGLDDLIGMIRRLAVHTRPGGFVAQFDLGV